MVRQTISKWEKQLSVPDAEMLERIAEVFEVPVSTLLGKDIPDNAEKAEENRESECDIPWPDGSPWKKW